MSDTVSDAVKVLRLWGVVAFPTETVYGLGADATNLPAVRKVFTIKGRPATNPVIVHVADTSVAQRYTQSWPDSAERMKNGRMNSAEVIALNFASASSEL